MTSDLASALGHVRNAVWQLLSSEGEESVILGLECLELEAILNQDDAEPRVMPFGDGPAASLALARDILASSPQPVPPAAWAAVQALIVKLG